MSDSHSNIYTYFRGAAQTEQEREKQLEDNTTKALVNTLEHSDRRVSIAFLDWLGISTSSRPHVVQQKSTIGDDRIRRASQRLLLGIVGAENEANQAICNQLPGTANRDSRPDAWLFGDNFVVLLESKIGEAILSANQMSSVDGVLSLRLGAPDTTVNCEDPITVVVELRNNSDEPVNVLRPFADANACASWFDLDGPQGAIDYTGGVPSYPLGLNSFTELAPGQSICDWHDLIEQCFEGSDLSGQ